VSWKLLITEFAIIPAKASRKLESTYINGLWIPAFRFATAGMTDF